MLGFLGVWFFIILSPTSSFVPIVTEVGAERRMYLPLAGLAVLVVTAAHALVQQLARRGYARRELSWIAVGASLAVAGALAGATMHRNQEYRTPVSIWRTVVDRVPSNPRGHGNLGEALHGEGQIGEAIVHYRRSLELDPERAIVHYNLGNALREQGARNAAIRHYREAVRIDPDYGPAHNNLANELQLQGELDPAIAHYLRALEIKPDNALAHYNLGEALRAQGRLDAAMSHYQEAAKTNPGYRPFALASIAMILATHPDREVRDVDQAIEVSKRAAELTGYRNPAILVSLAMAYAAGGRSDDAQQIGRQALQLAIAAGNEPLVRMIRTRLGETQEPASRSREGSSPTVKPSS
jgi:tetratricopeptide (TPR) repeat protein